jgi:hypothetical protein
MARIFDSFYVERPEAEARFEACYNLDRLLDERIANLWQFITILTVCLFDCYWMAGLAGQGNRDLRLTILGTYSLAQPREI